MPQIFHVKPDELIVM